jgi:hypothetical protein
VARGEQKQEHGSCRFIFFERSVAVDCTPYNIESGMVVLGSYVGYMSLMFFLCHVNNE